LNGISVPSVWNDEFVLQSKPRHSGPITEPVRGGRKMSKEQKLDAQEKGLIEF
jgi:hypothetical protein